MIVISIVLLRTFLAFPLVTVGVIGMSTGIRASGSGMSELLIAPLANFEIRNPFDFVLFEVAIELLDKLLDHQVAADGDCVDSAVAVMEGRGETIDDKGLVQQFGVLVEFASHEGYRHFSSHCADCHFQGLLQFQHERVFLHGLNLGNLLDCVDSWGFYSSDALDGLQRPEYPSYQSAPLLLLVDADAQLEHEVEYLGHESSMAVFMGHQTGKVFPEIGRVDCGVGIESLVGPELKIIEISETRLEMMTLHDFHQFIGNSHVLVFVLGDLRKHSLLVLELAQAIDVVDENTSLQAHRLLVFPPQHLQQLPHDHVPLPLVRQHFGRQTLIYCLDSSLQIAPNDMQQCGSWIPLQQYVQVTLFWLLADIIQYVQQKGLTHLSCFRCLIDRFDHFERLLLQHTVANPDFLNCLVISASKHSLFQIYSLYLALNQVLLQKSQNEQIVALSLSLFIVFLDDGQYLLHLIVRVVEGFVEADSCKQLSQIKQLFVFLEEHFVFGGKQLFANDGYRIRLGVFEQVVLQTAQSRKVKGKTKAFAQEFDGLITRNPCRQSLQHRHSLIHMDGFPIWILHCKQFFQIVSEGQLDSSIVLEGLSLLVWEQVTHDFVEGRNEVSIDGTHIAQGLKQFLGFADVDDFLIEQGLLLQIDDQLVDKGWLRLILADKFGEDISAGDGLDGVIGDGWLQTVIEKFAELIEVLFSDEGEDGAEEELLAANEGEIFDNSVKQSLSIVPHVLDGKLLQVPRLQFLHLLLQVDPADIAQQRLRTL